MKALLLISVTLLAGVAIIVAPQFTAASVLTLMLVGPLSTLEV